jgi:hypothetical protein
MAVVVNAEAVAVAAVAVARPVNLAIPAKLASRAILVLPASRATRATTSRAPVNLPVRPAHPVPTFLPHLFRAKNQVVLWVGLRAYSATPRPIPAPLASPARNPARLVPSRAANLPVIVPSIPTVVAAIVAVAVAMAAVKVAKAAPASLPAPKTGVLAQRALPANPPTASPTPASRLTVASSAAVGVVVAVVAAAAAVAVVKAAAVVASPLAQKAARRAAVAPALRVKPCQALPG